MNQTTQSASNVMGTTKRWNYAIIFGVIPVVLEAIASAAMAEPSSILASILTAIVPALLYGVGFMSLIHSKWAPMKSLQDKFIKLPLGVLIVFGHLFFYVLAIFSPLILLMSYSEPSNS